MVVHSPRRAWSPRRSLGRTGDRRLAALAAAGDEAAFEAIFERHHRGLLSLARHLLGSPEEAEDALQHTFTVAYRQLVRGEAPEHLRAWLYATARNRCLDVLRSRRELPAGLPAGATAVLSEEIERRSDVRDLVADIGRLPEDQRAALVMSELGDLGHAEVAEALGCRPEKVRALVYQARVRLAGWREARALPCREVREELAIARGGALRRGHLRRHLKLCPECAAFRDEVERQRRQVAGLLPVLPAVGLKAHVLEAAWGSGAAGAGGGAAAGAAGGGAAAGAGSLGAAALKIGAVVVVLGGAGTATFGGLPSGEPPQSGPSATSSTPASQAVGGHVRRERVHRGRARTPSKRLRASEHRARAAGDEPARLQPAPSAELPETQVAPPSAPVPQQPAPAPPAPSPEPTTTSPDAEPQQPPAEERTSEPDVGLDVEVEVDPPDGLP